MPSLEIGGAEQSTLDVAAAVVRAGGRSIVVSSGGRLTEQLIQAGSQFAPMPVDAKNPLTLIANGRALARLMRRERVSVAHVRSRAPAFSVLWAARRTKTPVLATYHGFYKAASPFKRWYNGVMTRGDHVIANSAFTRDHLLAEHKIDPVKVTTIPRGVDLARFDPEAVEPARVEVLRERWGLADDSRLKFILAGRLTRWKGQTLAIEALGKLRDEGLEALLILVGDSQGRSGYVAELAAAARDLGLTDQVKIVGPCSDMPAAYLAADVALAPSLKPEAFGRTAVEPQAMGRPVIAAAHGATRETVVDGETGWLAASNDTEAWSKAMGEAMRAGPQRLMAMGLAGKKRARDLYSVQIMTDSTLAVYRAMLGAT